MTRFPSLDGVPLETPLAGSRSRRRNGLRGVDPPVAEAPAVTLGVVPCADLLGRPAQDVAHRLAVKLRVYREDERANPRGQRRGRGRAPEVIGVEAVGAAPVGPPDVETAAGIGPVRGEDVLDAAARG